MKRALVLLSACAVLRAADLPETVRPIVALARSAPPEFFADTIVRLVEGGRIPSPALQVELLEDAFQAAAGAKQPMQESASFGTLPDTRAIYQSKAGELHLDALSLQTRILKALLTVDRAKALALFTAIPRPELEPRSCEDPLVPEVSAYYEIAGAVAEAAFSPGEKAKGQPVQFLLALLSGARSPNELAPFARAIQSVGLKPPELEPLLSALGEKLATIAPDERPFSMSIAELRVQIGHLDELARALKLDSQPLARGFRSYLVTQITAPRCSADSGEAHEAVEWFNSSFRGALPAIAEEELPVSKPLPAAKAEQYFQTGDSKRLGEELTRLRTDSEKLSADWRASLTNFLSDLAAWSPSGSSIDVFHQKATVLRALLELIPLGADRDRVLTLCVSFLQGSAVERESPAEWLWQMQGLLEAAGVDAPKLRRAFQNSDDAGLVLYSLVLYSGTSK